MIQLKKWGIKEEKEIQEGLGMFKQINEIYNDDFINKIVTATELILNGVLIFIDFQKSKV